jgi:hypothetical protein
MMKREDKILYHIDTSGVGIEIGPSYNPVAPKRDGYRVHSIDHMSRAELIEKYKDDNVPLGNIEEVDFVWKGEPYSELTGKTKYPDWIIASHVIEHTPDLIGFLNECDSILKDDGALSLVIPDKRFCFDCFRPITGLAPIIDSHLKKRKIHSPGTVAEFYLNGVSKGERIAWAQAHDGEYRLRYSIEEARGEIERAVRGGVCLDVHSWCFTPQSFRLILNDLCLLRLTPFGEVCFLPTEGCEFFVTLGRKELGIGLERLDLLKQIDIDVSWDPVSYIQRLKFRELFDELVRRVARRLLRFTRR